MWPTTTQSQLTTKGSLLIGAAFLVLLLGACSSPSAQTTSAPTTAPTATPTRTLPPSSPGNVAAGEQWSGQANQVNYGSYQMILTINSLQGATFAGNIHWPSFNTTTKMNGSIISNFGDSTEQQHWHYVPGFDKGTPGTYVKFTETDYLDGSGVELNDVYYALVQPDGSFQGVWFRPNENQPNGDFHIQAQKPAA